MAPFQAGDRVRSAQQPERRGRVVDGKGEFRAAEGPVSDHPAPIGHLVRVYVVQWDGDAEPERDIPEERLELA